MDPLSKRVVFGAVANDGVGGLQDLSVREFMILALMAGGVLILGLWPAPLVDVMAASVENLVTQVTQSKL